MLVYHFVCSAEELHEEIDDSFESELLWREYIEIGVEAVTFIELCNFSCQFIGHGESGGGVAETRNHMSEVVLQFHYFFLQAIICFLKRLPFLFAIRHLSH